MYSLDSTTAFRSRGKGHLGLPVLQRRLLHDVLKTTHKRKCDNGMPTLISYITFCFTPSLDDGGHVTPFCGVSVKQRGRLWLL